MPRGDRTWSRQPLLGLCAETSTSDSFPLFSTCSAWFQPPPGLTFGLWRWQGPGAPPMRLVTHSLESGRGRCPYSPHEPFTGLLLGKREWGAEVVLEAGLLGMVSAGRSWQVPVFLLCCTWLWAQAGAEAGARERSHPSPAPAHPSLMVATQSPQPRGCYTVTNTGAD